MTLEGYANFSNYAVAAATVVLALAWLSYVAEWAFGRRQLGVAAAPGSTTRAATASAEAHVDGTGGRAAWPPAPVRAPMPAPMPGCAVTPLGGSRCP
ncbi:MAG: hypothetical protein WKF83_15915 [Nocardioidaceae bacterium]